ncbi:hypothetical protein [Nonomuraea dietziae]|uniref:hypothetical protein n=1 Tax=Nonomuraea dietziae TaxID=65515 RepID=UPI0033EF29B3
MAGQEIYVTSSAIAHLRGRLDNELLEAVSFVRGLVGTTAVDGLGFGIAGDLLMGGSYQELRHWADRTMKEAEDAVDGWLDTLGVAQRNWRAAEQASAVRYR